MIFDKRSFMKVNLGAVAVVEEEGDVVTSRRAAVAVAVAEVGVVTTKVPRMIPREMGAKITTTAAATTTIITAKMGGTITSSRTITVGAAPQMQVVAW
jgi:hypothetical protein